MEAIMTKENMMRYHRIYNIVFSIVIVFAGICLMAGCLSIYHSGNQPFSRESVAATFSGIAFPVILCLVMTILSFIFEGISPSAKESKPKFKPYQAMINRLHLTRDFMRCDESLRDELMALQKKRRTLAISRTVVLTISSIVFLIYALNGSHFHQSEINSSMIHAMMVLTPCMLVSFAYALYVSLTDDKILEKEIELMKQIPPLEQERVEIEKFDDSTKMNYIRCAIIALAVFFIITGYMAGGTIDVLAKAINICTECIGLG